MKNYFLLILNNIYIIYFDIIYIEKIYIYIIIFICLIEYKYEFGIWVCYIYYLILFD